MDFGDLTSRSDVLKKCRISRTITDEADLVDLDDGEEQLRFTTEIDKMM